MSVAEQPYQLRDPEAEFAAVVFAAGSGTRVEPHGEIKSIIDLDDATSPVIRVVGAIAIADIKDVFIVTNQNSDVVERHLRSAAATYENRERAKAKLTADETFWLGRAAAPTLHYVKQPPVSLRSPYGTTEPYALTMLAQPELMNKRMIARTADDGSVSEDGGNPNIANIVEAMSHSGVDHVIVTKPLAADEDPKRFGILISDPDGKLVRIVEQPSRQELDAIMAAMPAGSTYAANISHYGFGPQLAKRAVDAHEADLERIDAEIKRFGVPHKDRKELQIVSLIQDEIDAGSTILTIPLHGEYYDVGSRVQQADGGPSPRTAARALVSRVAANVNRKAA